MDSTKTMVTVAVCLLSFVLGILGVAVFGGWFGTAVVVVAALVNLFSLAGFPFMPDYPNVQSATFFSVPAVVVALIFGFCFIGWGMGFLYALFALVVYLVFAALATK